MKLLYLYISKYEKLFENQEFIFSNEYSISYINNQRMLKIEKNQHYLRGFYGTVLCDITAIIGKNGVGKTTLLDLIGRDMENRIELSTVNLNHTIDDKYFLVYHVRENIFYCEVVGNIIFENIVGFENIIKNNNKRKIIFHSCYFKFENNRYEVVSLDYPINDNIIYINDDYRTSTHDLATGLGDFDKLFMLKRVPSVFIPLVEWYEMYVELYNYKMVTSSYITINFKKSINFRKDNYLVIQPFKDNVEYTIHDNLSYTDENFNDFLSHFMSEIINYFIEICSKVFIEDSKYYEIVNIFCEKWSSKVKFSINDYKIIFSEFEKELIMYVYEEDYKKENEILNYFKSIVYIFFSIHNIKDCIIPGIGEFKISISGKKENKKVKEFFRSFMKLKKDFKNLKNKRRLNYQLPFEVSRINISNGEEKLITILSKITYEIKNSLYEKSLVSTINSTQIVLIDEIENGMHLEWSRNLIEFISMYLEKQRIPEFNFKYKEKGIQVQLIFSTHSPFLLSDLNRNSIIALEKENGLSNKKHVNYNIFTFAQNIQRIMANDFFIKDSYGSFAQKKIQNVIIKLNSEKLLSNIEKNNIERTIEEVGEPILKRKLREMFIKKINIEEVKLKSKEIKLVQNIKKTYGDYSEDFLIEKLRILLKNSK